MTVEEIKNGLDAAYKKAGPNAYFGQGFHAGVSFAEKKTKYAEMYEALKEIVLLSSHPEELTNIGNIAKSLLKELDQ